MQNHSLHIRDIKIVTATLTRLISIQLAKLQRLIFVVVFTCYRLKACAMLLGR